MCEHGNSSASLYPSQTVILRGGASAKNYTVSTMNNHLQYKHPDEHKAVKLATNVKKSEAVLPDAAAYCITDTVCIFD